MLCICNNCKAQYNLKEEYLGKTLECPNCKNSFIAQIESHRESNTDQEVLVTPDATLVQKWIFWKHLYGIKQKKIAINEKYYVKDENNNDLFFSVRRIHFWRRFFAIIAGTIIIIGSFILWLLLSQSVNSDLGVFIVILTFFVLWVVGAVIVISLASKRGIEFYLSEEDMNKNKTEFNISQDNTYEFINKHFTLRQNGVEIAQFTKNIFTDILRKKWHMFYDGKHILIKEESVILGILRRLGIPFIRTNFIFLDITENPQSDVIVGYFKRKFEIFDNYLLDMTNDPTFIVPREIAICMAILLDCGERR